MGRRCGAAHPLRDAPARLPLRGVQGRDGPARAVRRRSRPAPGRGRARRHPRGRQLRAVGDLGGRAQHRHLHPRAPARPRRRGRGAGRRAMTGTASAEGDRIRFRLATAADAEAVAALHTDSWQRNYRGAYSDSFLDGDVLANRRAVWTARLAAPRGDARTIVAEDDGAVVGFSHVALDDDPTWGALLDNLHVVHSHARTGIGSQLLALTAEVVVRERPSAGLYLWVLEQNTGAQAFYEARGGRRAGRETVDPPGGDPSRINDAPAK